jgi:hypothetical protein
VDHADRGGRLAGGQRHVFQRKKALLGEWAGCRSTFGVPDDAIALPSKAIVPVSVLAPRDQIGGAVERP